MSCADRLWLTPVSVLRSVSSASSVVRDASSLMRDVLDRLDDSHDAVRSSAVLASQCLCAQLPPYATLDPTQSMVCQWLRLLDLHANDAANNTQLQWSIRTLHQQLTLYATGSHS